MNNKKQFTPGMNVGSSSILVTFVLLCLVTFAALSFVSANADHNLAVKTGDRIKTYYEGDTEANKQLAYLDEELRTCAANAAGESAYYDAIAESLSTNDTFTVTNEDGSVFIHYEVPFNENQVLSVTLKALYPADETVPAFTITEWQNYTVYTPEEESLEQDKGNLLF